MVFSIIGNISPKRFTDLCNRYFADAPTHLRNFEKIYNLRKSASFKNKETGSTPLTPSKIRSIRKMLKLTQFQFANLLGISKTTVSYWENGHLHPCRENQKILHMLATYGIVGLRRIESEYKK